MEEWKIKLEEAKKEMLSAERLYFIGISVLKDSRILIKILNELLKASFHLIEAHLKFEKKNFKDKIDGVIYFLRKIAPKYLTDEEKKDFTNLLKFSKMQKETPLEFVRKERLIIYYNGKYEAITKDKILNYSKILRKLSKPLDIF